MHSFPTVIKAIINGDDATVAAQLRANPSLATTTYGSKAPSVFYKNIAHYMYGGDTALHMAAAASRPDMIERLLAAGADVRARNRRGAEPLHYAADPNRADPSEQASTIRFLIAAGA